MSLKEGRKEGRRNWSWRVLCEKVPPARARGRNAPISLSSRNWTRKAHNNYTLWDRTSGRRRWAFLGQPAHCGTKPRWAFLGRHCGSRPNRGSAFLGHRRWDQTKVGFSWTPLWDRTQTKRRRRRWAFLGFSWTPLWNPTTPDQTTQN